MAHKESPGVWTLVVAANSDTVLNQNLLKSPCIDSRCQVIVRRGFASAGAAYNSGLAEARHEIIVFAHQDVYLPPHWLSRLETALCQLAVADPAWGVLGVCGIAKSSVAVGHVYSTGLGFTFGRDFRDVVEAESLDEVLLVVRRSSGLAFDVQLPGFHLYGTDICLEAQRRGMKNYIFSGFCVHNSNGVAHLPWSFWRAYLYLRRKWWDRLPISTSCTRITRSGWPVARAVLWEWPRSLLLPSKVRCRTQDVEALYRELVRSDGLRNE